MTGVPGDSEIAALVKISEEKATVNGLLTFY